MRYSNKKRTNDFFPLIRLFPNVITLLGLCFGLFAVKLAIEKEWEHSVLFMMGAAFIDGIDGRIARFLKVSSDFGSEIDSLVDFFNFGIAPVLISYIWITHEIREFGWAITIFFCHLSGFAISSFQYIT